MQTVTMITTVANYGIAIKISFFLHQHCQSLFFVHFFAITSVRLQTSLNFHRCLLQFCFLLLNIFRVDTPKQATWIFVGWETINSSCCCWLLLDELESDMLALLLLLSWSSVLQSDNPLAVELSSQSTLILLAIWVSEVQTKLNSVHGLESKEDTECLFIKYLACPTHQPIELRHASPSGLAKSCSASLLWCPPVEQQTCSIRLLCPLPR